MSHPLPQRRPVGSDAAHPKHVTPERRSRSRWFYLQLPVLSVSVACVLFAYRPPRSCVGQCTQLRELLVAVLDARPFDGQGYPDSFAQLLDHLDVVANDQSIIGASGLLDGWQPHHVQWLLIAALDERSLPGVKFAAAQGAVRSLDDATLQGMLTGVTGWCASRGWPCRACNARGCRSRAYHHCPLFSGYVRKCR